MSAGLSQSEQDDIDRAIALSLAQDAAPSPKSGRGSLTTPILLDSSSSDEGGPAPATAPDDSETEVSDVEELAKRVAARKAAGQKRKATVALSKENSNGSLKDGTTPATKKLKLNDSIAISNQSLNASESEKRDTQPAFLTRAQMEKERLARQASRESASNDSHKAYSGFMASTGAKYAPRVATLSSISSETSQTSSNGSTSTKATATKSSSSSGFASLSTLRTDQAKRRYWQGICRPTSSRFHSGYECFSFEDIIGDTGELQSALLTTFCGDPGWIHRHFPADVKVFLVMPAGGVPIGEQIPVQQNMILFNPRKETDGFGCMHIKLIILYHKTFLRVAVATANLIDYDWSTIENAVYVQDFPRISGTSPPNPFLDTLLRCHQSLGTPFGVYKNALTYFDYGAASNIRLVLSIPGNYKSPVDVGRNGHTGMATALAELGLATPAKGAKLSLECQGSSTGAYTLEWLRTFYRSCLGWDPLALVATKARSESSKRKIPWKDKELPDLKIVYPTFKTVKESKNGTHGGGTIFCDLDKWNKPDYVSRPLFVDSRSQREGLLQHTKQILGIVRPANTEPEPFFGKKAVKSSVSPAKVAEEATPVKPFGWLYVGSHNFSLAAWGRYSERTGNMNIGNHELGVIIPLRSNDPEAEAQPMITFKRPVQPYGRKDTPWDQHKYRRENGQEDE